jgi:hypothetical protein
MEESSLLGDALIYQGEERENNWICGIKQELETLGIDYMWKRGKENDKNSRKMVSQRCVDTERQGMDTIMREKKSLLPNSLKMSWQKEVYTSITTRESSRSIVWWRMGIWRLKGIRKNVEIGICPICRKEKESSHILRCDGMKMGREEILDKRSWNINPEIGIRKIAGCKNTEIWQKSGRYLSRYRGKWERMKKKNKCDDMSNLD